MGILIHDEAHLSDYVHALRVQNKHIVWTNGCFDIFHVGHAYLLDKAKSISKNSHLIVGVNSDDSIRRIKGDKRPIITQSDRAKLLCYLQSVDAVIIYSEDTPLNMIKIVQPDVIVKGLDWSGKEIVGYDIVMARGGCVKLFPIVEGRSTSEIINKILGT